MKTINRIQQNGAAKAVKSQAQTSRRKPENGSIVITDKAVGFIEEAESVLKELERVGQAATALAMMNALKIENECSNNAGWEKLNTPGFDKGSLELAKHVSLEFSSNFATMSAFAADALRKISGSESGLPVTDNPFDNVVAIRSWIGIDNAIKGFKHLIQLQGWTLCEQGGF